MNKVFDQNQILEILVKASQELKQNGKDFILSDSLRLEEAMLAYDLENPRMDKYLININDAPLYQFKPPTRLALTEEQVIFLMDYSLRALFTWMTGRRPLSDTIVPITAFIKLSSISHIRSLYLFILGCWRVIELVSDLVIASEVVKKDEFIFGTCGLLPMEASRSKNNIIIADLQEQEKLLCEDGRPIKDSYWRIRFVKFWAIFLTGLHLGQPIQLILDLFDSLKACLDNFTFFESPDLDAIGVYPLSCNLFTNTCPKLQIEPILSISEVSSFLFDNFFPDLSLLSRLETESHSDLIDYLRGLPFCSTLGRCIFAFVLFRNRLLHSMSGSICTSIEPKHTYSILKILLHSPPRQWRLFRKNADLLKFHSLDVHWIELGTKLGLLEESEKEEANEWINFIQQNNRDVSIKWHDQRYLHRWVPLIQLFKENANSNNKL